jgi:hypothetical protein
VAFAAAMRTRSADEAIEVFDMLMSDLWPAPQRSVAVDVSSGP